MNNIGSVVSLFRYPIKSMAGEKLESTIINKEGVLGDRSYALIDTTTNKIVSAKNPRKWPDIFKYYAKYINEPTESNITEVEITFPNNSTVKSTQEDINQVLSSAFNGTLKLISTIPKKVQLEECFADIEEINQHGNVTEVNMANGTFFDLGIIHLLTTSTIKKCEELYADGNFHINRFRPNIVVDLDSKELGFIENEWIGKNIAIGDEVILKIKEPSPRCIMTTLEQDNLPKDINILKTILKNNNGNLGIYADVVQGGRIKNNDVIKIIK
ncbi:MAG: MOSC domain-containing protein [Sulfurimonas sp.]|nr:MOSC domain-containing protein [Sulfurimonas sp.]